MSFPLVSIIVPVYNVKPYLCECLDSIINQSYSKLEIIIINDGSTDGSGEICDKYQIIDNRIQVIHQKNRGLSAARNLGLDIMHGDIIAFLDSDDAFLPNTIDTMVKCMIKTKADIVVCGFYFCHTTKHMQAVKNCFVMEKGLFSSEEMLHFLIEGKINPSVWNKIYRKDVFYNLRFSEGHLFEDLIIMPNFIENSRRIAVLNNPLILYRIRPSSITNTFNEKNLIDLIYARNIMEKFIADRIPTLFTDDHNQYKIEMNTVALINYRLMLMKHKIVLSTRTENEFNRLIDKKVNAIKSASVSTKTLIWFYKHLPLLFIVMKDIYCRLVSLYSYIKRKILRV